MKLSETLLAHPLLSQFFDIESQSIDGIDVDELEIIGESYKIGVKELRKIFQGLCKKHDEAYQFFLTFDYDALQALEVSHPFYLETSDVIGQEHLLEQLFEANNAQCKPLALAMLDKLKDWIDANTSNTKDLFDDQSIETLSTISVYMPGRVFTRINEIFTSDFLLSSSIFEHGNYSAILKILQRLALTREYFNFSIEALLLLAEKEGKSGVYHGEYKAGLYLSELLLKPVNELNVSYQDRRDMLQQHIQKADKQSSYFKLYTLMHVLGSIAGNLLGMDVYTSEEEAYVRFTVHQLLHYSGRADENGLCIAAEEQLHFLLEQLASIDGEREFLTKDFTLYLGAKKAEKRCVINVDKELDSGRSLHERQSLAERLICSATTNIHKIDRSWPRTTYIVANFGLVISDRPHIKGGEQKRTFISVPIQINDLTITGRSHFDGGHAEEALYSFLLDFKHVKLLLETIRLKLMVETLREHKVYAFVLDLHGTYDMCQSCSDKGIKFQNDFREQISTQLAPMNIRLPLRFKGQLPVVLRYSSDIAYHYPRETNLKKIGLRTVLQDKACREIDPIAFNETHERSARDIRHFSKNLLVHGKSN